MNYVTWLVLFMVFPIIFLFVVDTAIFLKYKWVFGRTIFGALLFAYLWDFLSIKEGIWFYPAQLAGINLFGLPVEEYLFIILGTFLITYLTLICLKKYGW